MAAAGTEGAAANCWPQSLACAFRLPQLAPQSQLPAWLASAGACQSEYESRPRVPGALSSAQPPPDLLPTAPAVSRCSAVSSSPPAASAAASASRQPKPMSVRELMHMARRAGSTAGVTGTGSVCGRWKGGWSSGRLGWVGSRVRSAGSRSAHVMCCGPMKQRCAAPAQHSLPAMSPT